MARKNRTRKVRNAHMDRQFLTYRAEMARRGGFSTPRYIWFGFRLLELGLKAQLYEARETRSKYITIFADKAGPRFKVRFSNHKPNEHVELSGDCDFYVGHTNTGIRTSEDALRAVEQFFRVGSHSRICRPATQDEIEDLQEEMHEQAMADAHGSWEDHPS